MIKSQGQGFVFDTKKNFLAMEMARHWDLFPRGFKRALSKDFFNIVDDHFHNTVTRGSFLLFKFRE